MVCTYCGGQTRVTNSRHQRKSNQVWRRRQCRACEAVFTSEEAVQYAAAWRVRNGSSLQPFSRDKLFISLYKSCEHRKSALSDAAGLADTVMRKLPSLMTDAIVTNPDITHVVLVALTRFDKPASVRYQALHLR